MSTLLRRLGRVSKIPAMALGFALIGIQFVPVAKPTSTGAVHSVHAGNGIDGPVGAILNRACMDCHSSNTRLPWYSHVAPVSWLLIRDVSRGRAKLDFSQQSGELSANQREEICDAVSDRSMPLPAYTLMHRSAKLSSGEIDQVCDWASARTTTATQNSGPNPNRSEPKIQQH